LIPPVTVVTLMGSGVQDKINRIAIVKAEYLSLIIS